MKISESERQQLREEYKNIVPILPESKETCTLKLPNGKQTKLPILRGTEGPAVLDIKNIFNDVGCFTYDPGFTSTGSCMSSITFIDGEKGKLMHRGYNVEELAEKSSYIELCYLLLYGSLPAKNELQRFEKTV